MLTPIDRTEFLRGISLFQNFSQDDLARVATMAQEVRFVKDEVLITEGAMGNSLYLILSGQATVLVDGIGQVAVRGPGTVVGEMSILSDRPRMASCVAVGETVALKISHADFQSLMAESPTLAQAIIAVLVDRLDDVSQKVARPLKQENERREAELTVARQLQLMMLPTELPEMANWEIQTHYNAAREVGGDFYDIFHLSNEPGEERIGIVIGDVTDKGVPAALVMATTCTLIKSIAQQTTAPDEVLRRVNELVYPDIPAHMFATCFYGVLNPANGDFTFANAGHDLPYQTSKQALQQLHAKGMPLGLMPTSQYDASRTTIVSGETLLFVTDGLTEAHNAQGEMFGHPRIVDALENHQTSSADPIIPDLLQKLTQFVGPTWEQEDDLTLMTLTYNP